MYGVIEANGLNDGFTVRLHPGAGTLPMLAPPTRSTGLGNLAPTHLLVERVSGAQAALMLAAG